MTSLYGPGYYTNGLIQVKTLSSHADDCQNISMTRKQGLGTCFAIRL